MEEEKITETAQAAEEKPAEELSHRVLKEKEDVRETLEGIIAEVQEGARKRFRINKNGELMVTAARYSKAISEAGKKLEKKPDELEEERALLGEAILAEAVIAYAAADMPFARDCIGRALQYLPAGTAEYDKALRIQKGLSREGVNLVAWIIPLIGLCLGVAAMNLYGPVNGLLAMGALVLLGLMVVKYFIKPDIFKMYLS